ncbi:MAG TPA: hypothetical protein VGT79_05085 [Xanthomonadaceae bacterium]|nr:hypothetical protein [Xanthomonadaceae bacterium]
MQQALAHHDAILRDAIEANDRYLVKTTDDAVVARRPSKGVLSGA